MPIVCAIIFFGFFGFADEARKNYRSALETVTKKVGITISTGSYFSSTGSTSGGVLSSNGVKSKTGSSGKVRPVMPVFVHKEFLSRHDSIDSFSNMSVSLADAGGLLDEKKDNEKSEQPFCPTLSYGGITLSDVGGTLPDYAEGPYSPTPSSGSSSASTSSVVTPEPALTRTPSDVNIEVSSLRRDSAFLESSEKAHTHDIV